MKKVFYSVCVLAILPLPLLLLSAEVTPEDAEARLRMALQIARERNDPALVAAVEDVGRSLSQSLPPDADAQIRGIESKVGIDPGGWSMAGQPLFRPTPELKARQSELHEKLERAMAADDPALVRSVTGEMLGVLGAQAGVPDGRRAGRKAAPATLTPAEATHLFIDALRSEGRAAKQIAAGQVLPDQMARLYAGILTAAATARPFVQQHAGDDLTDLDKLAHGAAAILLGLQQPAGHFPFPDLRGKNIRFGDMTEKLAQRGGIEIHDGWIVSADPNGGTQFDTALCGSALLVAARVYGNDDWRAAGLRAAEWALKQSCCANFNYNAFSVSLLAEAFRSTQEPRYLDAAMRKFRVGLAPGQAPNGRWLDPHNARTVYHVILLRALADLAAVAGAADRAEVHAVLKPALEALLTEFEAMGITVEALPELLAVRSLYPQHEKLGAAIASMTAVIVGKCTDGSRVKLGAQPNQLAAVPGALVP